jgi:hypothetical protein
MEMPGHRICCSRGFIAMEEDSFSDIRRRDAIGQGRTIILAVALGFYCLWIVNFLGSPVLLVPGLVYDHSYQTAVRFICLMMEYALFGLGLLLTWAGLGWARYALALYLFVVGLISVIVSIDQGGFGGALLVLGAVEIAGAVGLGMSIGVHRFIEDRRRTGVPWLSLGLSIVALTMLPVALVGICAVEAVASLQMEERYSAVAKGWFQNFASDLDPQVLQNSAGEKLKQDLETTDFADYLRGLRAKLGALRAIDLPPDPTLQRVVTSPVNGSERAYHVKAHYEHGDIMIWVEADMSGAEPSIFNIDVEEVGAVKGVNR